MLLIRHGIAFAHSRSTKKTLRLKILRGCQRSRMYSTFMLNSRTKAYDARWNYAVNVHLDTHSPGQTQRSKSVYQDGTDFEAKLMVMVVEIEHDIGPQK